MTAVGDPRAGHARCGSHLARLAALACGPAGAPLPPGTAAAVAEAAGAVLAEAHAAWHAVTGTDVGEQARAAEFLAVRLDRLAAARPPRHSLPPATQTPPPCAGNCAGSKP
jgi:hypothetical protein